MAKRVSNIFEIPPVSTCFPRTIETESDRDRAIGFRAPGAGMRGATDRP